MATIFEESALNNRLLPRIIFIACGSFSPPTLLHFRMFEIARDYFEQHQTHQVVGGIVSPTHDAYGKDGLASATHRCAMVKLALQSSKWIRMSDWETQQNEWSRTLSVLQYHQNYLNNYIMSGRHEGNELPGWLPPNLHERRDPVQLRLLCGADLLESFAKPGVWAEEDIENIVKNHGLVVISRTGANPEKFIFDSDLLTRLQRHITLVPNWVTNDVSSTIIRRLVRRGLSVKYLIDDLVLEYIKTKCLFKENGKAKYITDVLSLGPAQLVDNVEYVNQVQLKVGGCSSNNNSNINDKNNANHVATTSRNDNEDIDDDIEDVERMDETDFAMKNILNSFNLNNRSKVFCCGDSNQMGSKLLSNRNSPGQAVRTIITAESGGRVGVSALRKESSRESEELKPKKMKITDSQDV